MEVFVSGSLFGFTSGSFPTGSCIRDVVDRFLTQKGFPSLDFYVTRNGRRSALEDPVHHGAVYRLEPRLCAGKGGFGSMLRALGAQIEKTTNREACRDLSGRRLRDVNHEKEMAEWLKKQSEREAEKEQRRLERLQRKLAEPKHQFTDPEYQRQCHDLSERLEDSVLKGMQASSSGLVQVVQVEERRAAKRPSPDQTKWPTKKKKCFWTGADDLDELASSEEEEEGDEEESPSTSASSCGAPDEPEPEPEPEPEREPEPEPEPDQTGSEPTHTTSSSSPEPRPEEQTRRPEEPPEEQTRRPEEPPEASRSSVESTTTQQPDGPVTPVDLEAVGSVQELEELGLEVLKVELMSRGLKCGGTLPERAARLFSVRGLKPEQVDPTLMAKPGRGKKR